MAIPSRVLGSGVSQLSTVSICGDGNASVVAAGTSAGNATVITYVYNNVTTVAAGAGVRLPPTEMGETIIVRNGGANPLLVYPYDSGSSINIVTHACSEFQAPLLNCYALIALSIDLFLRPELRRSEPALLKQCVPRLTELSQPTLHSVD